MKREQYISPFQAVSAASAQSHGPRCLYTFHLPVLIQVSSSCRLIAGVRRWIGSHPPSRLDRNQGKKGPAKPDTQATSTEPELDTHSTEYLAAQMLNPSVLPEEEAEYQGCVLVVENGALSLLGWI
jgi:hypothetical protein